MSTQGAAYQPIKRLETSTILQRIGKTDKSAVEDCINAYGNLIWALVTKHTNSIEEAEEVTLKIFNDIWKCASHFDSAKCTEKKYVLKIVSRHLASN